jgi:hypothetical protein
VNGARSGRLEDAYAAGDLDALFPDDAARTAVPWATVVHGPSGGATAAPGALVRAQLEALLARPPRAHEFLDLDPRDLRATQSAVTRAGVAYYLGWPQEYERSGRTYAEPLSVANKWPLVTYRQRPLKQGDWVLHGGHHRAAAALLEGRPLRVRVATPIEGRELSDTAVVTPRLLVGGTTPPAVHHQRCDAAWQVEVWTNVGVPAWLPHGDEPGLRRAMWELAAELPWFDHQLHYARTGQIRPVPDAL